MLQGEGEDPQTTAPEPPVSLGFLRKLGIALVGGRGYRRLAEERRGWYLYFVLVAGCTALVMTFFSTKALARQLDALSAAWSKIPAFTIDQGHVVVPRDVHLPVRAQVPGAVAELTAAPSAAISPAADTAWIVVSGTQLTLLLASGTRATQVPLTELGLPTITKDTIAHLLGVLRTAGLWMEGVFSILYLTGWDFARAVIIAWVALVIARLFGHNPTWVQSWRIGMASWTLPLIVEVVSVFVAFPHWSLWVVAGCYAVVGCLSLDSTPVQIP